MFCSYYAHTHTINKESRMKLFEVIDIYDIDFGDGFTGYNYIQTHQVIYIKYVLLFSINKVQ